METTAIDVVNQQPSAMVNWIAPANIQQGLQLAEMMAKAKLIPEHLREDPGSCLLVLEQASRWRMSPFAVAQCTAVVRGKLCFEGKLVAAVLIASGAIVGRLAYDFSGSGPDRSITITGTPKGGKPVSISGSVKTWATQNDNWKRDPDSMLVYRGTRQWARIYAPEAMLGVYTSDEIDDSDAITTTATVTVVPAEPEAPRQPEQPKEKPAAQPKPQAHPAINAARDLYRKLKAERGGKVIDRLCALYGVKSAAEVPADELDQFGQNVAHLTENLNYIESILDAWEQEPQEAAQ